jgi:hypothetical protein
MARRTAQFVSRFALAVGLTLLVVTAIALDRRELVREARALGIALPLVLLPSLGWHLLRTAGWWISFPVDRRPSFWRVFRVRLAADGIGYFTVRGAASEPLRVVLLLDRVPAAVSTAATVLERTAMGIMSVVGVGLFASIAVGTVELPAAWARAFTIIAGIALVVLMLSFLFLTGRGHYLAPLFGFIHRRTGWRWSAGRAVTFVSRVEDIFLTLARTEPWRIQALVALSVLCYLLMAVEVWLVFRAIGEPVTIWTGTIIETFTRSMSVPGAAIPANLGALEASNVAVAQALGLLGGGSLALARRLRSLLWAVAGLALYPRDTMRDRVESR